MRFLNPRTDFAFKKIFGSSENKGILISFLNALLYQEQPVIEDLEILDLYQPPAVQGLKDSFLDVKARITGNTFVVIEMQVLNVLGFKKRILYNATKAFSNQLQSCANYDQLYPVIALTITDFLLFSHPKVISRYLLKEMEDNSPYDPEQNLQLVFAELPKFQKSLEDLETLTDRWLYFLKEAETLTLIPASFSGIPPLCQALEVANLSGLTPEELQFFEGSQMVLRDRQNALAYAEQQGRQSKAEEIARSLLGRLPLEEISEITGLAIESLQKLTSEP